MPECHKGPSDRFETGRLDRQHLRVVLPFLGNDDERRRPPAFDIELDAPEPLDRYVEHQPLRVRHGHSAVGHDDQRIAGRCLDLDRLARLDDAESGMIVHGRTMVRYALLAPLCSALESHGRR
jgi:hypothetical protein